MGVPLQISVEIGTTKRPIKEILEFTPGAIVELECHAGDPVEIMANGCLIARGDIVVIDDDYAIRVTEIVNANIMNIPN